MLATAAASVLLGATSLLFLAPPVVHLLLDVSGAATSIDLPVAETHRLSDALVADLVRGGDFGVTSGGSPLLTPPERSHLADVGSLLRHILVVASVGGAVLVGAGARRRSVAVRAFGDGAVLLVVAAVAAGIAFAVAFDATFAFAHGLVFAAGTWTFDEASSHLVQLYPERFWIAAALGFCATLIVAGSVAIRAARR